MNPNTKNHHYAEVEMIFNENDGLAVRIGKNSDGFFNAVFIDTDANQMIQAHCGIKTYEEAVNSAHKYLGIKS